MANYRTQLRGLNTELSPHRLPEGTADRCVNVTLNGGTLARRKGMDEFEDDVTGSGDAIQNMAVGAFGSGAVHLVCKCDDGGLWQRELYPTPAASFSQITQTSAAAPFTTLAHDATQRGSFWFDKDRLYYFDKNGGCKWNPAYSANSYKAGLPRPTLGPTITTAGGGEKYGSYHVHYAFRNSLTGEVSAMSYPQTGATIPLYCDATLDTGGIAITDWSLIQARNEDYERDQCMFLTTMGNTELSGDQEVFSYWVYPDATVYTNQVPAPGLNKADHVLRVHEMFRNEGGEPPGCLAVAFDGCQAVYAGTYTGSEAALTKIFTGNNNDIVFTARSEGMDGNTITIAFSTSGGVTAGHETSTLTVSGETQNIVVQIAAAGGSTASQAIAAIAADAASNSLIIAELTTNDSAGNTGAGAVTAFTAAPLVGGKHSGGALMPGRIYFSKPDFPCMVPKEIAYAIGGDSTLLWPRPWAGWMDTPIEGPVTGLACYKSVMALYTPYAAYYIQNDGSGRRRATLIERSLGCADLAACVGTPHGVHAFSGKDWSIVTGPADCRNHTQYRLRPTLAAVPAAYRDKSVMAYWPPQKQVWLAVGGPGSIKADTILIYDASNNEFSSFKPGCLGTRATLTTSFTGSNNNLTFTAETPGPAGATVTIAFAAADTGLVAKNGEEKVLVSGTAITIYVLVGTSTAASVKAAFNKSGDAVALAKCALAAGDDGTGVIPTVLGATALAGADLAANAEGITAMCAVNLPTGEPQMLIGTDKGRVLAYPGTADTDAGVGFAARWRGYFGQSSSQTDQLAERLIMRPGAGCAGNLRYGVRSLVAAGDDAETFQKTGILQKDSGRQGAAVEIGPAHGNIYQLEFFSPQDVSEQWTVNDVNWEIKAT